MNSVVLKGKLGAGFIDDRYTLPKDGNPGDVLVKTESGSIWKKQEPAASGGRVFVTGTIVENNGVQSIATDKTEKQIKDLYNSGKDVILVIAPGENFETRALYNGRLFYSIAVKSSADTIEQIALMVFGEPSRDPLGQRTLWTIGQFALNSGA
nr:MAG TPA: hypothetical protein [Caudoviricetes sp.]